MSHEIDIYILNLQPFGSPICTLGYYWYLCSQCLAFLQSRLLLTVKFYLYLIFVTRWSVCLCSKLFSVCYVQPLWFVLFRCVHVCLVCCDHFLLCFLNVWCLFGFVCSYLQYLSGLFWLLLALFLYVLCLSGVVICSFLLCFALFWTMFCIWFLCGML